MCTKLITAVMLITAAWGYSLTTQELLVVRDGFEARRDTMLSGQVTNTFPGTGGGETGLYVWNRQDFALAALFRNTRVAEANQAIVDACNALLEDNVAYDVDFHWYGNLFYRIYKFFGTGSEYYPGRLTTEAEQSIYNIFWVWTSYKSKLSDADYSQSRTWYLWGSENHDAMRKSTSYSAADILKDVEPYKNYNYDDGAKAAQHYAGWNTFFKEYLRERAKKGLLVELGSHTYSKYTLQGWYNFYDFAPDAELKKLAGMTLDLWWADWAQDQIGGVRGGGKSRIYQDADKLAANDGAYRMSWYYTNKGVAGYNHPGTMCLATSAYRMPLVVMDIALDTAGRGVYETRSRRPGLNLLPKPAGVDIETNALNPDNGGILRYTYTTPHYVLGTCMVEPRAETDWSGISSQNRWSGVIFANHVDARIFPQCVGLVNGKTYNQYHSVQNKGTLITQKLISHKQAGDMRVYFSGSTTGMTITEEGGWIFAQLPNAYAAVRPAWGTYTWDDAKWLKFSVSFAPVIMEVAMSSDYSNSFAAFKSAVLSQTVSTANNIMTYTGLGGSGTFTFYTNSLTPPAINGVTVNFQPDYTFQGPFVNEQWNSGIVTIEKDGRDLVLDFNNAQSAGCGDWGYFTYDLNADCIVDIKDFLILADDWLFDKSVITSGSDNYPNIEETGWPLLGNYNIPRASVVPTIDGVISPGEWMDARTIEMVHPALVTRPNTGTYGTGYAAPSSAADLSLYWYVKWDNNYLYLSAIIYDDIHIADPAKDSAVFSFNFNSNPAATFPSGMFLWVMGADGTISPFYTPGPKNSLLVGSLHSGHKILEARFPWSDLDFGTGYAPSVNDVHGFGLAFLDHDAGGVQEHFMLDYGSGTFAMTTVSTWNKITLVEEMPFGEAGVSFVDHNNDAKVDFVDYVRLADDWLLCSHPLGAGCISVE